MSAATVFVLATRLHNLGAIETLPTDGGSLTAEEARDAITAYQCEWAVCARINGKISSFKHYFEAVYQEKLDGKPVAKRKGVAGGGA